MRLVLATILFLTACSAFSQNIEFPPRCSERLLTPTAEALCTELRGKSLFAEELYLKALSKVDSWKKWNDLDLVKLKFMAKFYECQITGSARAVIDCLTPAYQDALDRLQPATDGTEMPLSALQMQARQVNDAIEASAHDLFHKCAFERIGAIDDGISSARDIAQGVGAACRPQASKWAEVRYATLSISLISPTPSLSDKLALIDQIVAPDNLVETVLEYRASKRLKAQPQKSKTTSRKVEG